MELLSFTFARHFCKSLQQPLRRWMIVIIIGALKALPSHTERLFDPITFEVSNSEVEKGTVTRVVPNILRFNCSPEEAQCCRVVPVHPFAPIIVESELNKIVVVTPSNRNPEPVDCLPELADLTIS